MGLTVTGIVRDDGRVVAVETRARNRTGAIVEGDFFITAAGRGTGLRSQAGLSAHALESSFDIYWMKFDPSELSGGHALVPDGFHAYLQDDSMFIFYRTYDHRIQVAWVKRGWSAAGLRDLTGLKTQLVRESPALFREMIAQQFSEKTERQLLKVACDRLDRGSESAGGRPLSGLRRPGCAGPG